MRAVTGEFEVQRASRVSAAWSYFAAHPLVLVLVAVLAYGSLFVASAVVTGGWRHHERFHGGNGVGLDTCAAHPARESAGRAAPRAP